MEPMLLLTGAAGASSTTTTTTCRPCPTTTPQPPRTAASTQREDEEEGEGELRRGPWTVDEDLTLINYIAEHGEGRWNALARAAGLKRTGKSCRLRWLNYLRPDVKRGDFTADEQLLILDLHSRWGNRWSKIAAQLPGRTDNEIKNYWRTRVQKHARQLGCDVNSRRFKDAMTHLWMPRLAERAAAAASSDHHHHHHSSSDFVAGDNGNSSINAAAAAPCPSAPTTTTANSSCVVPSSSSSDSSLTSTESTAAAHEEKSVHYPPLSHGGDVLDFWTTATTMMQGTDDHHEFWSTQEELSDMPDLTGWVQGFSDHHNSLWSLDDMVWRTQY